jgi:hypothetical protein
MKDTHAALLGLLEDNQLTLDLTWYPRHMYMRKGNQNIQIWDEEWDGDDWWVIQVIIPTPFKLLVSLIACLCRMGLTRMRLQ